MISIVIPMYNAEKYISECIDSCLAQDYEDTEIIIVNDGSKDSSPAIAGHYEEMHPDKVRLVSKPNGGIATALNTGMKNMKGNWFKWISADDKFANNHALSDMMKIISSIPNHTDYLFYTDYDIIDEHSKFVRHFAEPDRTKYTRDLRNAELLYNFYGNGSSSLLPKKIIDEVGMFRESMPFGEDLEYWLRICVKFGHTLYHLPLTAIQYRVHSQQTTQTMDFNKNMKLKQAICDEYYLLLTDEQKKHLEKLKSQRPMRRKVLYRLPSPFRNTAVNLYRKLK